jgi:alpha-L-rhamnosidase
MIRGFLRGLRAAGILRELPQYIPPFSLLWIGMLHDNYMYRPDKDFVKSMLPGTRTVLDWFAGYQHPDGLLAKTAVVELYRLDRG